MHTVFMMFVCWSSLFAPLEMSISKSPNFTELLWMPSPPLLLLLWCDDVIWEYARHSIRRSSVPNHIISAFLCFRMYSLKCNSRCDTHNWYATLLLCIACNRLRFRQCHGTQSFLCKVHTKKLFAMGDGVAMVCGLSGYIWHVILIKRDNRNSLLNKPKKRQKETTSIIILQAEWNTNKHEMKTQFQLNYWFWTNVIWWHVILLLHVRMLQAPGIEQHRFDRIGAAEEATKKKRRESNKFNKDDWNKQICCWMPSWRAESITTAATKKIKAKEWKKATAGSWLIHMKCKNI